MRKVLLGLYIFLFAVGSGFSAADWRVRLEEAKVNIDLGQYKVAEDILRSLQESVKTPQKEIYYYLGLAQMGQEQLEEAERSLKQAEQLGPEDMLVKTELAYLYIRESRAKDAEAELEPVLLQEPGNGRALYLMGLAAILKNDCNNAEGYLAKAKKSEPALDAEISFYQGLCARSEGKSEAAARYFDEVIKQGQGTVWAKKAEDEKAKLARPKPYFLSGDFIYQYDSNVLPIAEENALPTEIRHMSDSRAVFWLQAGFRPMLTARTGAGIEYHFYNSWHSEVKEVNLQVHQGVVKGFHNFDVGKMAAKVSASYLYQCAGLGRDYDYYSTTHRINPSFFLAENSRLATELSYYFEDEYFAEPGEGDFDRDNISHELLAGQHFYVWGGKVDLGVFGRYIREDAEGRNYNINRYGARVFAQLSPYKQFSGYVWADYDYRDYFDSSFDRVDEVYQAAFEADYQLVKNLGAYAAVSYGDFNSRLEAFEYERTIFSVGLRTSY